MTERQEFIFNVDRLATYLIGKALEFIPTGRKTVTTPTDVEYDGGSMTKVGAHTRCVSTPTEQDTLGSMRNHHPTIVSAVFRCLKLPH